MASTSPWLISGLRVEKSETPQHEEVMWLAKPFKVCFPIELWRTKAFAASLVNFFRVVCSVLITSDFLCEAPPPTAYRERIDVNSLFLPTLFITTLCPQ